MPTVEQGMPDPDAPKAKADKKEEDIGDMWEKYWNMDPDNYIWGIDPNEAPPEVMFLPNCACFCIGLLAS